MSLNLPDWPFKQLIRRMLSIVNKNFFCFSGLNCMFVKKIKKYLLNICLLQLRCLWNAEQRVTHQRKHTLLPCTPLTSLSISSLFISMRMWCLDMNPYGSCHFRSEAFHSDTEHPRPPDSPPPTISIRLTPIKFARRGDGGEVSCLLQQLSAARLQRRAELRIWHLGWNIDFTLRSFTNN